VEDFRQSQSLMFVTQDSIVVTEDMDGQYRVFPLAEIDDLVIDKNSVDGLLNSILPWIKYIPWILVAVIFLAFVVFLPLYRLFSLVFLALILVVAAKLLKLSLGYKKIYQIGLHSLTLPTLIQIGMSAFGLTVPIPFFISIVFLLYTLVILADLRKNSSTFTNHTLKT